MLVYEGEELKEQNCIISHTSLHKKNHGGLINNILKSFEHFIASITVVLADKLHSHSVNFSQIVSHMHHEPKQLFPII